MPAEPAALRKRPAALTVDSAVLARLGQAHALFASARAALAGTSGLPPRRRTRAAALFARSALELIVLGYLAAAGHDLTRANMRSQLICLTRLVDDAAGRASSVAWAGLSRATHEHAFELSPTWGEVSHLVDLVEGVAGRLVRPVSTSGRPGPA